MKTEKDVKELIEELQVKKTGAKNSTVKSMINIQIATLRWVISNT